MTKFIRNPSTWIKAAGGLIILLAGLLLLVFLTRPPNPASTTAAAPVAAGPTPTVTHTPTSIPSPTSPPTDSPLPAPTTASTRTPTLEPETTEAPSPPEPGPTLTHTVQIPVYTYRTIQTYPHDRNAFTQGLIFEDGIFYEGTGRRGHSTLRKVVVESGAVLQRLDLPPELFGEGVTIFGDRIIQLTWQAHIGFVYDKESFELIQTFSYPTEGWGLTHDGRRIIMSDGTSTLYFRDPATLAEIGRLEVFDDNGPVRLLNELEYIRGEIYANVWQTDRIARIDPQTGQVTGWIDLAGLLGPEDRAQPVDVLNGIAYDAENDRLFVTGKLWPKLFEIELVVQE